jgi:hypothetical protein
MMPTIDIGLMKLKQKLERKLWLLMAEGLYVIFPRLAPGNHPVIVLCGFYQVTPETWPFVIQFRGLPEGALDSGGRTAVIKLT